MFLRNLFFLLLILSLAIFSSCGFIKIDFSSAAEQFTDFSPKEPLEDCGCFDPPLSTVRPCPKIYAPVCGCNGITYSNSCVARRAGIISYSPGQCIWDFYTVHKRNR